MATVYELNADYWLKKDFISAPFQRLLSTIQPGSRILDLGCGGGRLAVALSDATKAWGLDRAENLITQLKTKHPNNNWILGDAESASTWESLPQFDYILSNVCIRKDQCKLELIIPHIINHSPKATLLLRIQSKDDLKGYVTNCPGYAQGEIYKALGSFPSIEGTRERFIQKFTSGLYLRESISKIGLRAGKRAQGVTELAVAREYWLIKATPE